MKRFREKSIREQLKIIIVMVIVAFSVLIMVLNIHMQTLLTNIAGEYSQVTEQRLKDQLEFEYNKLQTFCIELGNKKALLQFAEQSYENRAQNYRELIEVLVEYKGLEPNITDISIVSDSVHYSGLYTDDQLDQIKAQMKNQVFAFVGIKEPDFFTVRKDRLKNGQSLQNLVYAGSVQLSQGYGAVIISMDISHLKIAQTKRLNGSYLLTQKDGTYIVLGGTQSAAQEVNQISAAQKFPSRISKNGYEIRTCELPDMQTWLVSAFCPKDSLKEFEGVRRLLWECVIVVAFFTILIFTLINRGVVAPIYRFIEMMRAEGKRGKSRERKRVELSGCVEMKLMGDEFNTMLDELEELRHQIFNNAMQLYEEKVQRQEAELAWLKSQIDPHFLYNTLETIRQMALEKGAPEIGQMAWDMGNIFRYSAKGDAVVSFEEELSITRSYLRIQQTRFAGKIDVHYFIPEDVKKIPVLKLILQPIVENAVFHGLEPQSERGMLFITARRELDGSQEILVITVKDNGTGIEKEKFDDIQAALESKVIDTSRHLGLVNTNARIRIRYGEKYGLQIETAPNDGTTVKIQIPVEVSGKDKRHLSLEVTRRGEKS